MATDEELETLYARLRQAMLSRHFALGRYFRVNLFSTYNVLGERAEPEKDRYCCGDSYRAPARYDVDPRPNTLLALEAEDARRPLPLPPLPPLPWEPASHERWRVAEHCRENPLVATGLRLTTLAIEYHLGHQPSLQVIDLALDTLDSLYKFQSSPSGFSGYILRFDAVSSDEWVVRHVARERETPVMSCNFLIHPYAESPTTSPYLYTIPLMNQWYIEHRDDRRAASIEGHRETAWNYQHYLRRQEPSMDEIVGLTAGYAVVSDLLTQHSGEPGVDEVLAKVRTQAGRLGDYLANFSYLLVRPNGVDRGGTGDGFAARGATGINPCLEYFFRETFARITGRPEHEFEAKRPFYEVLAAAGYWDLAVRSQLLWTAWGAAIVSVAGAAADELDKLLHERLAGFFEDFPDVDAGSQWLRDTARRNALLMLESATHFDLWDTTQIGEVALAPLFMALPVESRFVAWMRHEPPKGEHSESFKYFIALSLIGVENHMRIDWSIRKACIDWCSRHMVEEPHDETDGAPDSTSLAWALWLLLADELGTGVEESLARQIQAMHSSLVDSHRRDLVLQEDYGKVCEMYDMGYFRRPTTGWTGGYSLALALAWLYRKRCKEPWTLPASFPHLTSRVEWPRAVVPASVVAAAAAGELPVPVPVRGPRPVLAPYDLFQHPPKKRADFIPADLMPRGATDHVLEHELDPLDVGDLLNPQNWHLPPFRRTFTTRLPIPVVSDASDDDQMLFDVDVSEVIDPSGTDVLTVVEHRSKRLEATNEIEVVVVLRSFATLVLRDALGGLIRKPEPEVHIGRYRATWRIAMIARQCTVP